MKYTYAILLALLVISCTEQKPVDRMNDEQLRAYADELAHKYIITDGHVDLPYRLRMKNFRVEREYMGIPISTTEGDFDYERAKKKAASMHLSCLSTFRLHTSNNPTMARRLLIH